MKESSALLPVVDVPPVNEFVSAGLGGIVGGFAGGIVLYFGSEVVTQTALAFGLPDAPVYGWVTYLILSLVFGLVFAIVVAQLVDRFVSGLLSLINRSDAFRVALSPLVDQFGLRTVGTVTMGLVYGLVLGLVTLGIVITLRENATALLRLDLVVLLAYLIYGLVLGFTYGVHVRR